MAKHLDDNLRERQDQSKAKAKMLGAAKAGKPQVIDPKGSGMTAQEIVQAVERAGNNGR